MICPKCEEGVIQKILFKKSETFGFLCEYCGAVWQEGEDIRIGTSHTIQSLTKDDEMAYTFVDSEEANEEAKSILYPKYK